MVGMWAMCSVPVPVLEREGMSARVALADWAMSWAGVMSWANLAVMDSGRSLDLSDDEERTGPGEVEETRVAGKSITVR